MIRSNNSYSQGALLYPKNKVRKVASGKRK